MRPQEVAAMLREDREEWAALRAVLDAHREGALHDPKSPEWTARDVYTHLATLMEGSTQIMADYLAGRPVTDSYAGKDENEVNAGFQQQHGRMTFDEARAWAQRAFEGLMQAIDAVPPDRWDAQLERYARADGAEHYRGHRSYVRER